MPTYEVPVALDFTSGSAPGVNVWHLRTVAESGTDVDEALSALAAFYTAIRTQFPTTMTVTFPPTVIDVATDEERTYTVPPPVTGQGTGALPPVLQICVGWKTSVRARRGTGRTFIGPFASSAAAGPDPHPTALGLIQAAADALIEEGSGIDGWAFGVYGQESAGVPGVMVIRDFITAKIRGDRFSVLRSRRDN